MLCGSYFACESETLRVTLCLVWGWFESVFLHYTMLGNFSAPGACI